MKWGLQTEHASERQSGTDVLFLYSTQISQTLGGYCNSYCIILFLNLIILKSFSLQIQARNSFLKLQHFFKKMIEFFQN